MAVVGGRSGFIVKLVLKVEVEVVVMAVVAVVGSDILVSDGSGLRLWRWCCVTVMVLVLGVDGG